jgi:4,5-DOPA dioxygenase extradiol
MPALFIGHGSPMNAVQDNAFTRSLSAVANTIGAPEAILVVSAHWLSRGTRLTTADRPRQLYDFYGFPEELHRIVYRPAGAARFADKMLRLLTPHGVSGDATWGLDHASWAILRHMYPEADIPVVELSLDVQKSEHLHYRLGTQLRPLREDGILIIGSGNVVHNLGMMSFASSAQPYPWALEFEEHVRAAVQEREHERLLEYRRMGEIAALAVPTNEHYLPLLYAAALQGDGEAVSIFFEGIQHSSVSMMCVGFGL